jgi:hypothetical protein
MTVVVEAARLDPLNVFTLLAWKERGSGLWVRYKEECGKDIKKLLERANEEIRKAVLAVDDESAPAAPK